MSGIKNRNVYWLSILIFRQHSDGMKKLDQAVKDVEYYRQEAENLRTHYNDVVLEKQRVDQEVISLRRFLEEDRQEMSELRRQQQELLNSEVSKCIIHHYKYLNNLCC